MYSSVAASPPDADPGHLPPNGNGNNIDNNSTPRVARSNRRPSSHPERTSGSSSA
ncbi:hypothetical protein FOVG_07121 [Fusarium oxysporum f. sp. pisi HDV247]|uniref:Uncharacterized protein n=1 Tax=Fusarium oxysporum f. sp. pisi HDV247 TaxID=1080344 RepID=W9PMH3_FUSOX|nr:hypothetical protein FOVG_07121 [Fusarium oxysporum f. sp. pisi HDV247]